MTINEQLRIIRSWGYIEIIENHPDGVSVYAHTRTWGKGCHSMNKDKEIAIDDVFNMIRNSIRETVRLIELEIPE